jgi:23S rRNA (adenine2503-C2)-methyltransferase
VDLKGMTLDELEAFAAQLGEPPYRGRQLAHWLYPGGATSFADMTDLPASLRARLTREAQLTSLARVNEITADGGDTIKYLLRLSDGATIETVYMRYQDGRHSVCVSTQVGCGMGCTFCATGLAGLTRNLTAAEIIDQVVMVQRLTGDRVSNVVFMGMGEPLANYDATLRAVHVLNAPYGLNIGMRHLTLSTVGLVPQIRRLASEQLQLTLAISLHAPTDALRDRLVPVNRKWPVAELLDAGADYVRQTGRRVSFEYVLLEGVNDTPSLAATLGDLLRTRSQGVPVPDGGAAAESIPVGTSQTDASNWGNAFHVNLIPWNPVYGLQYQRPARARVEAFVGEVRRRGIPVTVRLERGVEIAAACGQLQRTAGAAAVAPDVPPATEKALPKHARNRVGRGGPAS